MGGVIFIGHCVYRVRQWEAVRANRCWCGDDFFMQIGLTINIIVNSALISGLHRPTPAFQKSKSPAPADSHPLHNDQPAPAHLR
jgi:hypothetical protein